MEESALFRLEALTEAPGHAGCRLVACSEALRLRMPHVDVRAEPRSSSVRPKPRPVEHAEQETREIGGRGLERSCGIPLPGFAAQRRPPKRVMRIGAVRLEAPIPNEARPIHS